MEKDKKIVRQMPYSIETEQAVLGSMLISENAAMLVCSSFNEDAFYSASHKKIYSVMLELYRKNKPIDYVTMVSELDKKGILEEVGGYDYLTTLTNIVPTAANISHYTDILKQDYVLRQIILAGEKIVQMGYESNDAEDALKNAEKEIFEIGEKQSFSKLELIAPAVSVVLDKFQKIGQDKNAMKGLMSGIYGLDKMTNGFQPGDLVLLAARPGVGKTSLAMNIVNHVAINLHKNVAVFSLEMSTEQLAQRSICSHAFVDMEKALKGDLTSDDWAALWEANKDFNSAQIFVDESSMNTPMDILSKCRKLKREKGLDFIMIDYLQLMQSTNDRRERQNNRVLEIGDMTRLLKITAKELKVPILLLSQLSRAPDQRQGDHRPQPSDLRDSGSIEQDADMIMFIYNPDKFEKDESKHQGIVELILSKHRNGPTGTIKLRFIKENTTFVNINQDSNNASLERSAPAERNYSKDDITKVDDDDIGDMF